METLAPARVKNTVTFAYHQAYNARAFGADYGERYHADPLFRIEQDRKVARGYYDKFGAYGMGSENPGVSLGVGIQPLDFMNAALGGRFEYKSHESVWTPDRPLSHVETLADVENLKDVDWEDHPLFRDLFRQVEEMQTAYPDLQIVHVQGVWVDEGNRVMTVMHTPYTTAFRLVGERVMELMLLEPEASQALFEWILRQYTGLWNAICSRMSWVPVKLHFGDCAATMLPPRLYQEQCLPLYQKAVENCEGCVIHSCGPSTHLLELFAQVPKVRQLQLGDGTDLKRVRELFPGASVMAYYDPGKFKADSSAEVERKISNMIEQLGDNFIILVSGMDPDTPEENVYGLLKISSEIDKTAN